MMLSMCMDSCIDMCVHMDIGMCNAMLSNMYMSTLQRMGICIVIFTYEHMHTRIDVCINRV